MGTGWPDSDLKVGVRVLSWRREGAHASGGGGGGVALMDVRFLATSEPPVGRQTATAALASL